MRLSGIRSVSTTMMLLVALGSPLVLATTASTASPFLQDSEVNPALSVKLVQDAAAAAEAGRWQEAADLYAQALTADPGSADAMAGLQAALDQMVADIDPQDVVDLISPSQLRMEEAREMVSSGRWQQVVVLTTAVLAAQPDNSEAMEMLRRAEQMLDRGKMLTTVEQELAEQRSQTLVEYDEAWHRSNELLSMADFDGASRAILTAEIRLRNRRQYLGEDEYTALTDRIDMLVATIDDARENQRLLESASKKAEAQRQQQLSQQRADEDRARMINENMKRVLQLQREMKYKEALQVIQEILFLDANNPAAQTLKAMLETTALYMAYSDADRAKEMGMGEEALGNQKALIPPKPEFPHVNTRSKSGLISYPTDWPDMSFRRIGEIGYTPSAADQVVQSSMASTLVPVDFNNNTFEQVASYFEQISGIEFYIDWRALDLIGVDRESAVTLQLAEIPMDLALDRVMEQLGDDLDRPDWTVQDGMLTVSSEDALRKRTVLIVYDVRDLLFEVPYFDNAPDLNLGGGGGGQGGGGQGGGGQGGGGMGGGGMGGGQGGGGQGGGGQGQDAERMTREELLELIINIIQENVDPDGWRPIGETGSLQQMNGNLIVTNTPRNHIEISTLLAKLREIRALQINVEARYLLVNSDWFEQIGLDFDLYFNTNSDMWSRMRQADPNAHLSDFFIPGTSRVKDPVVFGSINDQDGEGGMTFPYNTWASGAAYGVAGDDGNYTYELLNDAGTPVRLQQGWAPMAMTNNSLDLLGSIAGETAFAKAITGANPAFGLGVQFLDDIQVDLLIEATQADKRSVTLVAPRLTFHNGQRAWISVSEQQAYVSGLNVATGDSSGAYEPILAILQTGFVLDVEGVVSADRRYVTLNVLFTISDLLKMNSSSFGGAAGGGGGGGGGGGDAATFGATIQLPQIQSNNVQTTVTIPDKGTAMLGGQRRITEYDTEVGVPMLSKIPYVNRYFTNRLTNKEEKTLLLLIRPEIIIQQENEDILFPGLNDSLGGGGSYLQ